MSRLIMAFLLIAGAAPALTAAAALIGLGAAREAPPLAISTAAVCLVALPILGLAGLARHRLGALASATWVWSCALLIGLPAYFPGERNDAVATGLSWMAAPWGEAGYANAEALSAHLSLLLGEEIAAGRERPPTLTPETVAEVASPPPSRELGDDEVALPYEGEGRSLRIPVTFDGDYSEELWMLFDTGATYTTLNREALDALGIQISDDAPEITMQTAGGQRKARLVLLDSVWLGGFQVEGVTVAVCEACASDETAGLLGLNVSNQFQVTLDHDRREMVLTPRSGRPDRHLDVGQWVEISAKATAWSDGRIEVEVTGENLGARDIDVAAVGIECGDARFAVELEDLQVGETFTEVASLPRGTRCDNYRVVLDEAYW